MGGAVGGFCFLPLSLSLSLLPFLQALRPSHALLEAASQVALREPSTFEIDAMFDCFLQLRVVPPADFPISAEKKKQREERLKAREERQRRWKEKQGEGAEGEVEALEERHIVFLFSPLGAHRCALCSFQRRSWTSKELCSLCSSLPHCPQKMLP